jgi:periplasmic divalent cation tolerance protein
MKNHPDFIIVLATTANKAEAEKIAQTLLEEKLIACANIINPVASFFHWTSKINKCEECLVIMKSRLDLFADLEKCVKRLHSYEVPEVLALPIVEGSADYLAWMGSVLKQ